MCTHAAALNVAKKACQLGRSQTSAEVPKLNTVAKVQARTPANRRHSTGTDISRGRAPGIMYTDPTYATDVSAASVRAPIFHSYWELGWFGFFPNMERIQGILRERTQGSLSPVQQDAEFVVEQANEMLSASRNFEQKIHQLGLELHSLQQQSASIHKRLRRREEALEALRIDLKGKAAPVWVVEAIEVGTNAEKWAEAVEFLEKQSQGSTETTAETGSHPASNCTHILLQVAQQQAKQYVVNQLRALRRPGADAQVVQSQLASAPVWPLLNRSPRLFNGLKVAYCNTMRWYYNLLLGKYGRWLGRQVVAHSAHELLGHASNQSANFSAGARPAVLLTGEENGCLPMTAVPHAHAQHFMLEQLVSSALGVLASCLKSEEGVPLSPDDLESRAELLGDATEQYLTLIKQWVQPNTSDAFGLLLVLRLLEREETYLPKQLVEPVRKLVLPLLTSAIEEQAVSVEQAALKLSAASVAGAAAQHKQGLPAQLTQLLSAYLCGVLQLSSATIANEIQRSVRQLVSAYELYISRLAGGNEGVLHSNYFVMAALVGDIGGEEGALAREIGDHFHLLVGAFSTDAKKGV